MGRSHVPMNGTTSGRLQPLEDEGSFARVFVIGEEAVPVEPRQHVHLLEHIEERRHGPPRQVGVGCGAGFLTAGVELAHEEQRLDCGKRDPELADRAVALLGVKVQDDPVAMAFQSAIELTAEHLPVEEPDRDLAGWRVCQVLVALELDPLHRGEGDSRGFVILQGAGLISFDLEVGLYVVDIAGDPIHVLAVAHVLELAQGQDEPVLLRQPLGHVPDLPAGLVGLLDHDGVERASCRRQVRHLLVVFLIGPTVGPEVALAPPQLVVAEVARNGVDPAAEVERVVDPVHHPQGLHEGLLGDVLRQQSVPELASDQAEDGRDVAPVKLLERVGVTAAVGPDEINVGRLAGACNDRCVPYFVHFIFRLRQATTAARVNNRSGSFRACWGSPPCSVSVTTDVTPKLFSASQPGPLLPVSRTTGTPAAWARLATSPGALPKAVCSSTRPSPVMTRSAPRSLASNPAASTTRGAPGTRLASRKATRPAPVPPAAPAPGMSATLLPRSRWMTAASRPSAASSSRTACESAPFCGP